MDFKRALVRGLKGTFCKPIGRLFEAKRATIKNQDVKNYDKNNRLISPIEIIGLISLIGPISLIRLIRLIEIIRLISLK